MNLQSAEIQEEIVREALTDSQRRELTWWETLSFIALKRASQARNGPVFVAAGRSSDDKQEARRIMAEFLFLWYHKWPGGSPPAVAPERMGEREAREAMKESERPVPSEEEWDGLNVKAKETYMSQ